MSPASRLLKEDCFGSWVPSPILLVTKPALFCGKPTHPVRFAERAHLSTAGEEGGALGVAITNQSLSSWTGQGTLAGAAKVLPELLCTSYWGKMILSAGDC